MDPLSITISAASLAKLAFSLSQAIYSSIQQTKAVDETLQAFSGEISALADALGLIDSAFQDSRLTELDRQTRGSGSYLSKVLDALRKVLTDCEDTLIKLDAIIQESSKRSRSSLLRRSVTALKLNFKSADIAFARQQIQSYNSAMQMTLSMLNISLILSPHQQSNISEVDLQQRIESLEELKGSLEAQIASSRELNYRTGASTQRNQAKFQNLDGYLRSTEPVLSSATEYLGSISGSTFGDSAIAVVPKHSSAIDMWMDSESESFHAVLDNRRLELAGRKIKEKEYSHAETLLQSFLGSAELSGDRQEHQLVEARIMLAVSYQAQKKNQEAIDILTQLSSLEGISDMQSFHIKQILAETYLGDSRPKDALPYAIAACEGRYNRQPDDLFFESCLLVANTYLALGNKAEAELYLENMPPSYRSKLVSPGAGPSQPLEPLPIVRKVPIAKDSTFGTTQTTAAVRTAKDTTMGTLRNILTGHVGTVHSVAFSRDSCTLASGHSGVNLWDSATGTQLGALETHNVVESIVFSLNGRTLASAGSDRQMHFWEVNDTWTPQRSPNMKFEIVYRLAFSLDGRTLATYESSSGLFSTGKLVKIWEVATGKLQRTLKPGSVILTSMTFSPDSRMLVSGFNDASIKIWEIATWRLHKTLAGHSDDISCLAFSPDNRMLVFGSTDATIKFGTLLRGGCTRLSQNIRTMFHVWFSRQTTVC